MVSAYPQIDLDIIEDILLSNGKKSLSPFRLNRLKNAIQAVKERNIEEGIKLEAYYLAYCNSMDEALIYINKAIQSYPYSLTLKETYVSISIINGDWSLMNEAFRQYCQFNPKINEAWKDRIVFFCRLYEDALLAHELFPESDLIELDTYASLMKQTRKNLNVSLETYRECLRLMNVVLSENYDGDPHWLVSSENYISIVAYIENSTPEDTIQMTNELLDRVLNSENKTLISESESLVTYFSVANHEMEIIS